MALYNHVRGRAALLDAMIADLLDELNPQLRPTASPCTSRNHRERAGRVAAEARLCRPTPHQHPKRSD